MLSRGGWQVRTARAAAPNPLLRHPVPVQLVTAPAAGRPRTERSSPPPSLLPADSSLPYVRAPPPRRDHRHGGMPAGRAKDAAASAAEGSGAVRGHRG